MRRQHARARDRSGDRDFRITRASCHTPRFVRREKSTNASVQGGARKLSLSGSHKAQAEVPP